MVSNRLNVRLRPAMEVIGEVRLVDDDVVLSGLVKFNELVYTTSLIPGNESKVSGRWFLLCVFQKQRSGSLAIHLALPIAVTYSDGKMCHRKYLRHTAHEHVGQGRQCSGALAW